MVFVADVGMRKCAVNVSGWNSMTIFDGHNDKKSFWQKFETRLSAISDPNFISLENKIKDLLDEIHSLKGSRGIYITRCDNLEAKIKAQDILISKHQLEAQYLADKLVEYYGYRASVEEKN